MILFTTGLYSDSDCSTFAKVLLDDISESRISRSGSRPQVTYPKFSCRTVSIEVQSFKSIANHFWPTSSTTHLHHEQSTVSSSLK